MILSEVTQQPDLLRRVCRGYAEHDVVKLRQCANGGDHAMSVAVQDAFTESEVIIPRGEKGTDQDSVEIS
jgi:hypothetical protein